jgi:hypothetical protein
MSGLIIRGVVAAFFAIGARRMPAYYRRWYAASKKEWTYRTEQEHQRSGVWCALGLMLIWPYYESARWIRDTLIHHLTAEERAKAEYEQAAKIVADYKARKDREEREEFDRRLND